MCSPLVSSLTQQDFRRRLLSIFGQPAQIRRQRLERGLDLVRESLTKNFPVFRFRRPAVPSGTPLQPRDQVIVEIAHVKVAWHVQVLREIIDNNDLRTAPTCQSRV
jgi:hypothetical protein